MMAHPFLPMTTELLKKLTRINRDSNTTTKSQESPIVFASQELNSILESNSQNSETNHPQLPH